MNLKDAGLDKVEYVADRVHQVAEQEKSKNKIVETKSCSLIQT